MCSKDIVYIIQACDKRYLMIFHCRLICISEYAGFCALWTFISSEVESETAQFVVKCSDFVIS